MKFMLGTIELTELIYPEKINLETNISDLYSEVNTVRLKNVLNKQNHLFDKAV